MWAVKDPCGSKPNRREGQACRRRELAWVKARERKEVGPSGTKSRLGFVGVARPHGVEGSALKGDRAAGPLEGFWDRSSEIPNKSPMRAKIL